MMTCGDKEWEVETGDSILTGNGDAHSVRNTGNDDLLITALIVQY